MKHRATTDFWRLYRQLPEVVRELADEAFARLRENERHPSLHLKKVGRLWSARIGAHYRTLAVEDGADLVWFWIGPHDEYERVIRRR